jgi:hypothetical protein
VKRAVLGEKAMTTRSEVDETVADEIVADTAEVMAEFKAKIVKAKADALERAQAEADKAVETRYLLHAVLRKGSSGPTQCDDLCAAVDALYAEKDSIKKNLDDLMTTFWGSDKEDP